MNKTKAKARLLLSTLSVLLTLYAPVSASAQETYAGSNQDVRTVLYFNVSPAALSQFLPQPGNDWAYGRSQSGRGVRRSALGNGS